MNKAFLVRLMMAIAENANTTAANLDAMEGEALPQVAIDAIEELETVVGQAVQLARDLRMH